MRSKRIILIICTVLLAAILAVTLTSCLKIGMREKNVVDRLKDAGATVAYERTTPMTPSGTSGYRVGNIVHATMLMTEQHGEDASETEQHLYIFFAEDMRSADWAEKACKDYVDQNGETLSNWIVYRYEETVMAGYFKLVSIARQY